MTNRERAESRLRLGVEFPYDHEAGDAPTNWAHEAARGALADLLDRKGIKSELRQVDDDVRIELVRDIAEIIRVAAEKANAGMADWSATVPAEPGRYWAVMGGEAMQIDIWRDPDTGQLYGPWPQLFGPRVAPPPGWREALVSLDTERSAGED